MNSEPTKTLILHMLNQAREAEVAFGAALSEDERTAAGVPDAWSATYTLAHLTAAKRRLMEALRAMRRGGAPSLKHDEAQVYAENQGRTWDEVETEAQEVFVSFVTEIERLTETELTGGEHATALEGRPLAAQILGHGLWHPYGHLTGYYRSQGDLARARYLERQLIDAVDQLEVISMALGDPLTLYNLACLQVTAGRTEKALTLLEEALRLEPDLREDARADPDLMPLWGKPSFEALTVR